MKTGVAVGAAERDAVVGARHLAVLELGLGDRRTEVDVPEDRGLGLIGLASGQVAQEGALGDAAGSLLDRRVGHVPVDGQAEGPPEVLEGLLVDGREGFAQLDEVAAGHGDRLLAGLVGGLEVGVVGEGRIALDAVVVLDAALGGQPVVVPPHRVEDLFAPHALEAGDGVGVGVAEDVTDVQRAADRRGRGVDRVDLVAGLAAVEAERALLLPARPPGGLEAVEGRLVGDRPGREGFRSGGRGRVAHRRQRYPAGWVSSEVDTGFGAPRARL